MIRIAAGLSSAEDGARAGAEAAAQARADLDGAAVDLAFLFLSRVHREQAKETAQAVQERLEPSRLLGCVAQGVLGRDEELEEGPAAAVWAASLPGAEIETFHATAVEEEESVSIVGVPELGGAAIVAVLVDPFTFPVGAFVEGLNAEHPGLPLVGGIAVGGDEPGEQALVLDGDVFEEGALGAAISGVSVKAVVSQGCAPIGHDSVITNAERNVIFELAGQPALERLREEIAALPAKQQALAARGLLAGLVIDENKPDYRRGDFLVRGLLGADDETGALAVAEMLRVGQTLRFHVRDAASADEDLREALGDALGDARPAGALLFTCNGRGTNMFPEASHDARVVSEALGGTGLAGFFCGGEIGPVGGRTFLHGFTATMAVFLESE